MVTLISGVCVKAIICMFYALLNRFFHLVCLFTALLAFNSSALAAIEKSPNDAREYETLILDNQLRILLISDPTADKAAASMNVAVGSSADPRDRAGLAHFLEHMLFLGTDKYPKADEYQSYIRSHGGGHNAYTAQENTNYFFDVSAEFLDPALDRFAQFFIAPRFDEKYVDRERHAVHSEYQAKIKDDYRRGYAATKQAMNTQHSHNKFSVGSLKTLADREDSMVRDELIEFYQRYYSANLMTLVILGREPLPDLKQMAVDKFSAVENRAVKQFTDNETLFKPGQLPQQLFIEPVKDIRSLTLTFPIPEFRSKWQQKPLYYISSLVGYEGEGSLLSYLKEKGWATSLSASPGHNLETEGSFMVMMQLTESGLQNYLSVTQALFQYIELLKQKGIQQGLYEEEKQLSAIEFLFQEKSEPIHVTSTLARQMQYYPTEKVISAGYTFKDFDPALIQTYLSAIRPDNLFLSLKAKGLETDQIEANYKTPYAVKQFSAEQLSALQGNKLPDELSIRSNNPFIANNLDLLNEKATEKPVQIDQDTGYEFWYQFDSEFSVPRANFYFTVQTPIANQNAKNWVLNSLYTQLVQEQLNETLYDAYLAGMGTEIYPHMKGFSVRLSGYNDKLNLLLKQVVHALQKPDFDQKRFAILKQRQLEQLQNSFKDKPYNQTISRLYELLLPQSDKQSQLNAARTITLEDLKGYSRSLLAKPAIKAMAHGNMDKHYALDMANQVKSSLLKSDTQAVEPIQVTQIPAGQPLTETLVVDHNDAAITIMLQGENSSPKARAEISVLSELLSAPFYNELRTEKQLGYIVFATPLQMNKTPGMAFIVQSPNTSATDLEENIDHFLNEWQSKLPQLNSADLERFKNSVLSRITKKDNKLSTRTKRYWRELDWQEHGFDTKTQLANAVEKVTLTDLEQCLHDLLKRRLAVKSYGNKLGGEVIADKGSEAALVLKDSSATVPEV
ncbi:MAG: insulinase family protein [Neptuniibacter sp.]